MQLQIEAIGPSGQRAPLDAIIYSTLVTRGGVRVLFTWPFKVDRLRKRA